VHLTKNWMMVGCAPALFDRLLSSSRDQGDWGVVTPKYGASGCRKASTVGTGGNEGDALADADCPPAEPPLFGAGIGWANTTAITQTVMPASRTPLMMNQSFALRRLSS